MMIKDDITAKLSEIYFKQLFEEGIEITKDVTSVQDQHKLGLHGEVSSFVFIKLIVSIENEFGIEFDDEMLVMDYFMSLNDLIDFIYARLNGKVWTSAQQAE